MVRAHTLRRQLPWADGPVAIEPVVVEVAGVVAALGDRV
jgi:hypothetical protein